MYCKKKREIGREERVRNQRKVKGYVMGNKTKHLKCKKKKMIKKN